ncbi:MAG TPA: class I SAM-dependent methyltransferase [Anaerolineales bacterium]|jgi:hypothetical protein
MPNKTLEGLYEEHSGKVSDRWSGYLPEYSRLLAEYRDKPIALFEIGVQNGGSLEIWSAFFPSARRLVGCDINPDCAQLEFADPRIAVVIGDADSREVQEKVLAMATRLDVIIDDGSHRSRDIARTFARYFPFVEDGGVFIAEDLHCSYWQEFEGGLFDPVSSIAFFKQLADVINHEHWGVAEPPSNVLKRFFEKYDFTIDDEQLQHIHSVEFINSMCVVRRERPERNRLGSRFMAGSVAKVVPGHWELHGTSSYALDQTTNPLTARRTPANDAMEFFARCARAVRRRTGMGFR